MLFHFSCNDAFVIFTMDCDHEIWLCVRRWLKILVVASHLQCFNYQYASVFLICYIKGVHGGDMHNQPFLRSVKNLQ